MSKDINTLRPVPDGERLVEFTVQSNVFVVDSVTIPESMSVFGMGSQTEAFECGECYALVTSRRVTAHDMWHRELAGLAGQ